MQDLLQRLRTGLAGRYRVERELGRGGMALVFLAQDERHDRQVAVKVLRPDLAWSIGAERFLQEIRIAAGLNHPYILPLFDSGEIPAVEGAVAGRPGDGPLLYYVMPYVDGESLRQRLERERQLPFEQALRITRNVAGALGAAHAQGIIHRDIKPENILLEHGEAVVADFGIARALHAAAEDRLSEPGVVVGTPQYLSPEQSAGGEVDERTDLYSLGCVLYEMLAGEPPFTGATSQAVIARQQVEAPRPLRPLRPGLPDGVDEAVLTALAKSPADRYQTAGAMIDALDLAAYGTSGGRRLHTPPPQRKRTRWRRWPWLAGLGGLGIALAVALAARPTAGRLDESLVMVAPFAHRGSVAPALIDGELCELLLHRAVAHWEDVRLVDPLWVSDARARRGGGAVGLADALTLARERGAGRLLTGQLYRVADTIYIYGALYDVRVGTPVRTATVAVEPSLRDAAARFAALAGALVAGEGARRAAVRDPAGTRSLAAWQALDAGLLAFRRWDLATAERRFRQAMAADQEYVQPRLWLAQLRLVAGREDEEWAGLAREVATAASDDDGALSATDAHRARALRALADADYAAACDEYAALIARDSLDFLAWFGLAECRQRDRLVVPDAASPSGWRFRSSPQGAVTAYRRALELLPSSHRLFRGPALARLAGMFVTSRTTYRSGYRVADDTVRLGAWPGLEADTLVYVPYPLADLFTGAAGTLPATHARAVAHGRRLQREVAESWVRAFPASADARELLARAHEALGELEQPAARGALAENRRASRLTTDSLQRLRLAAGRVRLLVKVEQFGEARRLADSLLTAASHDPADHASLLAGLAMLTGHPHRAAGLSRRASATSDPVLAWDGTPITAPPPIAREAAALLAYAALGAPAESVRVLHARTSALTDRYFPPAEQPRAHYALLGRAESFAFVDGTLSPPDPGPPTAYLQQMAWDLSHGDTAAVPRRIAELRALRGGIAGDVTVDAVLLEARLLAAAGGRAAAAAHLDGVLTALAALDADLMSEVPLVGSLARAMAFRAELAAEAGDRRTARRWAGAVAALWADADPVLAPVVARMQHLGATEAAQ